MSFGSYMLDSPSLDRALGVRQIVLKARREPSGQNQGRAWPRRMVVAHPQIKLVGPLWIPQ
jgi:hypothetical protein